VLLRVHVERDRFEVWHAWFTESPHVQFSGSRPSHAIWSLFSASTARGINGATIISLDPESETQLRFTVEANDDAP
jgi:hypothetical protein